MLSRSFYDALVFWPIVAWPILFSSAFYAFLRLCQLSRAANGLSPLNGRGIAGVLTTWVFVPAGMAFEVVIHFYLLWRVGVVYIVMPVPIYVLGWIVLPALLDDFRPAFVLLPIVQIGVAASFLVLLGLADIGFLRAFNAELYTVLTGLQVAL